MVLSTSFRTALSNDRRQRRRPGSRPRRGRSAAIAVIATALGCLAWATPGLASTGSVFYDDFDNNVGAGKVLFNASTTGNSNQGLGLDLFTNLTTGNNNTAMGAGALFQLDTGSDNTAYGGGALNQNGSGDENVAVGASALG
jgi:hypothetical protein